MVHHGRSKQPPDGETVDGISASDVCELRQVFMVAQGKAASATVPPAAGAGGAGKAGAGKAGAGKGKGAGGAADSEEDSEEEDDDYSETTYDKALGRGGASEDKNEDVLKQKRARMREVANLTDGRPVLNHNAPKRAVRAILTDLKSHREKVAADRAAGGGGAAGDIDLTKDEDEAEEEEEEEE
jgi:hypothetical protein